MSSIITHRFKPKEVQTFVAPCSNEKINELMIKCFNKYINIESVVPNDACELSEQYVYRMNYNDFQKNSLVAKQFIGEVRDTLQIGITVLGPTLSDYGSWCVTKVREIRGHDDDGGDNKMIRRFSELFDVDYVYKGLIGKRIKEDQGLYSIIEGKITRVLNASLKDKKSFCYLRCGHTFRLENIKGNSFDEINVSEEMKIQLLEGINSACKLLSKKFSSSTFIEKVKALNPKRAKELNAACLSKQQVDEKRENYIYAIDDEEHMDVFSTTLSNILDTIYGEVLFNFLNKANSTKKKSSTDVKPKKSKTEKNEELYSVYGDSDEAGKRERVENKEKPYTEAGSKKSKTEKSDQLEHGE